MNMHINIDDKLVAVKKMTGFFDIGDVIKITEIRNHVISFVFNDNPSKEGQMDFNTCEKYFEKTKVEKTVEKTTEDEVSAVTDEYIAEIMENSEFETHTVFNKCTIVSCRLPNGFVITESSSCVNPEDFNEELAEEICFDKIAEKIWELEAYRLQQSLWEEKFDCPCCCEECNECQYDDEEEFDECLDTDLDCDDCGDFDCPFRP